MDPVIRATGPDNWRPADRPNRGICVKVGQLTLRLNGRAPSPSQSGDTCQKAGYEDQGHQGVAVQHRADPVRVALVHPPREPGQNRDTSSTAVPRSNRLPQAGSVADIEVTKATTPAASTANSGIDHH